MHRLVTDIVRKPASRHTGHAGKCGYGSMHSLHRHFLDGAAPDANRSDRHDGLHPGSAKPAWQGRQHAHRVPTAGFQYGDELSDTDRHRSRPQFHRERLLHRRKTHSSQSLKFAKTRRLVLQRVGIRHSLRGRIDHVHEICKKENRHIQEHLVRGFFCSKTSQDGIYTDPFDARITGRRRHSGRSAWLRSSTTGTMARGTVSA